MQKWVLNKETGRFELYEEFDKDRKEQKQKALFEYNQEKIKESD